MEIHLLHIKTPYRKDKRLKLRMSEQAFDERKQEWLLGVPRSTKHDAAIRSRGSVYLSTTRECPRPNWKPQDHQRIVTLIEEIEARFERILPRGADDCPFFLETVPMPANWSWWNCWLLFGERAQRMFLWCNGSSTPFDTTETLCLECIVQVCDCENPKYQDLLGLPLTLFLRHACRFGLGKIDHNVAQRSGWKHHKPTTLDDYDISYSIL